ncbi:malonyl-CoA decarboxylase [Novosphingobium malaysiense]|uniref:Malonyl-CoA decarboxylase n=1 Tax=Novosphingobium malaysiense TaxID=1348853 RepID=A0A0B1ZIW6_9SPHN|nr:malonyl-CoA decarboxylase [Novosphingobium malaysiense]
MTRPAAPGETQPVKSLEKTMRARLQRLLARLGIAATSQQDEDDLLDLAKTLLSLRGEASGPALASALLDLYDATPKDARQAFLEQLPQHFERDSKAIEAAFAKWQASRCEVDAIALEEAIESPLSRLIRRMNLGPSGTSRLLRMREDVLAAKGPTPGMRALDDAFEDAFTAWFNVGLLELRAIRWDSPGELLERIIRYEAVHAIHGWDELRRRVQPADRRCYGFFHPQMKNDPLIFVEVALTREIPRSIDTVTASEREILWPHEAECAIFYSISNCQDGLRGIPFGNYLIKRVVELLRAELPQLKRFATLSPVPGFARWLESMTGKGAVIPSESELAKLAAHYLTTARNPKGMVLDPVGRFHLGNGARLEAINTSADLSENGLRQSHGVMVNYLYDLDKIEANLFALSELKQVMASKTVKDLAASAILPA